MRFPRLLPLLWLAALASCTVYNKIVHPYRLPSPAMSPEAKAKARAAEKARHKGVTLKAAEPISDGAGADAAGAGAGATDAADKKKTLSYSELPTGTKLKYDKHLLLKKPKLERRQRHHYDTRPLKPRLASREQRRLRKHLHSKGKGTPSPKAGASETAPDNRPAPAAPAARPDPTQPAATPAKTPKAAVEKPAKVKEEKAPKEKKTKKAPLPKRDPTQPLNGDQ